MKILVLNCGSSSIKYKLFEMESKEVIAQGGIEKIGMKGSFLKLTLPDGQKVMLEGEILEHRAGIEYILGVLLSEKYGCIKTIDEIKAVGHRVVHGGERFNSSVLITDEVIDMLNECIELAPLHNPPNLKGIYAIQELLPGTPQVGVFDTAFHQTMPVYAYMYGLPYSLYEKYGIRRYGFHGTSHRYVSRRACEFLGVPYEDQRIITAHIGNGGSVTAIKNGKSIDTSMGMTPVEGLIMGTRSGDIDPAIIFHLHDTLGMSVEDINKMLTKESGLLGLTEVTSDCRYVEDNYAEKEDAKRAMDVYCHRLAKYIGSYTALMEGRLDAVIFTGGIGENAAMVRELSLGKLGVLGFDVDHERNLAARFGKSGFINKEGTRPALVIPTNEELVIAQDAHRLTA